MCSAARNAFACAIMSWLVEEYLSDRMFHSETGSSRGIETFVMPAGTVPRHPSGTSKNVPGVVGMFVSTTDWNMSSTSTEYVTSVGGIVRTTGPCDTSTYPKA